MRSTFTDRRLEAIAGPTSLKAIGTTVVPGQSAFAIACGRYLHRENESSLGQLLLRGYPPDKYIYVKDDEKGLVSVTNGKIGNIWWAYTPIVEGSALTLGGVNDISSGSMWAGAFRGVSYDRVLSSGQAMDVVRSLVSILSTYDGVPRAVGQQVIIDGESRPVDSVNTTRLSGHLSAQTLKPIWEGTNTAGTCCVIDPSGRVVEMSYAGDVRPEYRPGHWLLSGHDELGTDQLLATWLNRCRVGTQVMVV